MRGKITPLHTVDTGETRRGRAVVRLTRPFRYMQRMKGFDGGKVVEVYTVPEGFETDYGTIPRILWMLLPSNGKWRLAAVVHDYLCYLGVSRFKADAVFRECMSDTGVRCVARIAIYYGVRAAWLFWGYWFWNKKVRGIYY